jgi:cytochrome b pre-mRNA-processing protein 3
MPFPRFRRSPRCDTISGLYGTIVAQARILSFYRDCAVPDTLNGRFELIVLHLALFLDRLARDPALRHLGPVIFDHFCRNMDDNLREMGVGDLAVPTEMRGMGEAFYGRAQAYRLALAAADDDRLAEAEARNIYGVAGRIPAVARLVGYLREAVRDLERKGSSCIAVGRVLFPEQVTVPAVPGLRDLRKWKNQECLGACWSPLRKSRTPVCI